MEGLREYETLFIVLPEIDDDEQKKVIDGLNEAAVKAGAEIIKCDVWGKRKLAYPIKKRTEGVYVLLRVKGANNIPKDLDVYIRRTPGIIRHLTTVVTKQQLKEEARLKDVAAKRAEEAKVAAEAAAKRAAEEAAAAEAQAEESASQEAVDNPVENAAE